MDIEKLHYDLSLLHALIETLREQPTSINNPYYDLRFSLLENFESAYLSYKFVDPKHFKKLEDIDKD